MRLYKFLNELTSNGSVRDKDFPYGNKIPVLVFSKDEEYKEENNTHGLFSHAIKHFGEFFENQKSLVFSVFEEAVSKEGSQSYLVSFNSAGKIRNIIEENPKISDLSLATLLTTLDLIQDKFMSGVSVTKEETYIYNRLKDPISKVYLKIAEHFKNSAYEITPIMQDMYKTYKKNKKESIKEKIEKHKAEIDKIQIVKFNIVSRGTARQIVYDFKKSTLISLDKKGEDLKTLYQLIKHVKDKSLRNSEYDYASSISPKDAVNAILSVYDGVIPDYIYVYFPSVKL